MGGRHIIKTLNRRLFAAIGISQILNCVVIAQCLSSMVLVFVLFKHSYQKRGLKHCLSFTVRQCESLDSGISKVDSRASFYVSLKIRFKTGVRESANQKLRPMTNLGQCYEKSIINYLTNDRCRRFKSSRKKNLQFGHTQLSTIDGGLCFSK